jgi:hypothetical protein
VWHLWKFFRSGYLLLILQVEIDQLITVDSVNRENDEYREVRDKNQNVKCIQYIVPAGLLKKIAVYTGGHKNSLDILKDTLPQQI